MSFKIGDIVECTDDWPHGGNKSKLLVKNQKYEVIKITPKYDLELKGVNFYWHQYRFRLISSLVPIPDSFMKVDPFKEIDYSQITKDIIGG